MNNRKQEIEDFFIQCCESSSIYYDGVIPSIKYLRGHGTVVFFERSRMIDLVETNIPNYKAEADEMIIESIMHDSEKLVICESHEYKGCHYTLTVALKN